ncbi:MAG: efflux RND transporter periplasmic adaptor subunit [Synergistaceae bacterium]|nr:efflux RND transporter periplasmic adaptor subunit [Synergistaceae bacterium]
MKHFVKILIGALIIAGVCYGLNTLREKHQPEPEPEIIRPVRVITLTGGSDSMTRHYFGKIQGGKRADLSFRVSGTLNKINVEKGAAVKTGDLLATLDPRDFNTRISQASSSLSQAQAQYKNAQADFKRYENLYKQKVIARAQYDTYKTQLDVTRSAVGAAQANLKSLRDALKDTELRAPFDGIIADRTVENFQDVTAKQTIFSLQDLSALEIVFNIPDNDILLAPLPRMKSVKDLQKSQELFNIVARFEAMPDKTFPLTVKEVATQATAANTYPVTATMPQLQDIRALPGMAVTVEVYMEGGEKDEGSPKYLVPATSILNEKNKNFVWRFNSGKAEKISVEVGGIKDSGMLEIQSPVLHNGDKVITAGVYFLREGQKVRLPEE